MRNCFVLAALIAALSISQDALATDGDKQDSTKEASSTIVIGTATTVSDSTATATKAKDVPMAITISTKVSDAAAAPTAKQPPATTGVRSYIVTDAATSSTPKAKEAPAQINFSTVTVSDAGAAATKVKEIPMAITISSPTTLTLTIVKEDGSFKVSAGSLSFDGRSATAAPSEVRVRTVRVGKVVAFGPDGKPIELGVENEGPQAFWRVLPQDVREKLALPPKAELPPDAQKALQAAQRAMDAQALEAEKQRELATAKAAVAQAMAKAKVAEAEAMKARTMKEQMLAYQREMEALKAKMKAEIEAQMGDTMKAIRLKSSAQPPDPQAVNAKLDKILERLDRLEKEVNTIKSNRAN